MFSIKIIIPIDIPKHGKSAANKNKLLIIFSDLTICTMFIFAGDVKILKMEMWIDPDIAESIESDVGTAQAY